MGAGVGEGGDWWALNDAVCAIGVSLGVTLPSDRAAARLDYSVAKCRSNPNVTNRLQQPT